MIEGFEVLFKMDIFLQAYLILMVSDFVTGFLKAWKSEGFKSRKIRDGVIRVVGEIVAIVVCGVLDVIMDLKGVGILSVKMLFIFKEVVSINENLGLIGVNLPKFILDKISDLKDKGKIEDKNNSNE